MARHSPVGTPDRSRTYRHEVEPEDVVDPERFQLEDDRGQIAALHLRDGTLRQLVKGFL